MTAWIAPALLGGSVGDRPLRGDNQELADLHHDAIEAFSGVIDVLQTGSSVAVPPWSVALDATNRWLGMAEQGSGPLQRAIGKEPGSCR
jgi:hypothetical protein